MTTTKNLIPHAEHVVMDALNGIEADMLHGLLNDGTANFDQRDDRRVNLTFNDEVVAVVAFDEDGEGPEAVYYDAFNQMIRACYE